MSDIVDVYWSFRSPYSYLATPDLISLKEDYDVDVKLRVVLPVAVRKKSVLFDPSNMKPIHYILMDWERRADFLGLPHAWPNPDPVVQSRETFEVADEQPYIYRLCKLGVEAERRGKGVDFAAAVSRLIFGGTSEWDQGDHLSRAASAIGLDLAEMEEAIENGDQMDEVNRNQEDLDAAGHWGVPTMVIRGEAFFGQDRVDTLRWRLDQLGLRTEPGT